MTNDRKNQPLHSIDMKTDILTNLDNPSQLEKLYRADKGSFKRAFNSLYPEMRDNNLLGFWNARLNLVKDDIAWGTGKDLVFVIFTSLLAGFIAKLPDILQINEEFFYTRNAGFLLFPFLTAWFAWKNNVSIGKILFITIVTLGSLIFINTLPDAQTSDTLILSCIHVLVILWYLPGIAFVGNVPDSAAKRLDYLKYNGDLVVMTTLIMIAAGILSGVTVGLFSLIGINIEQFYFKYVVISGLPAAPILATYLIQTNPQLVGKVSPVIARIFSPLVLVMLVAYLAAIVYSGKDPYNDRDFLLLFNVLLIGVMAIIFFSVAESSRATKSRPEILVLLLLSALTIIVNGIALSAILFRITEWGITPNRAAVLGSNVLILIHLVLVTTQLFRSFTRKGDITGVGRSIALYLPVYAIWAATVTFVFPFLFGFK